jgi:hypothetical protein
MSMRKGQPLVATRAEELMPRELPLEVPDTPPRALRPQPPGAAERIREKLRRWLEEEL